MARARKQPWEPVFRRIEAIYLADRLYPPRPTAADLDAVEAVLGFQFPASYRAFAQEFGLDGELHLPQLLPLSSRPGEDRGVRRASVIDATQYYRTSPEEQEYLERGAAWRDLQGHLVVFAVDGGYHTFFFNSAEVTDKRSRECRIYSIERDFTIPNVADSFGGWLAWVDEDYRIEEDDEIGPVDYPEVRKPASPDHRPMRYHRRSLRPKETPAPPDIQAWLSWKDGTVGHLARAIQEEGRGAEFPVLADALEDAGCTHPDLLAACRSGAPDVDGVWVLRVLLGNG
jgi:hypothetical protein